MRKFQVPSKQSKRAMPKAVHNGEKVRVRGVDRLDEAQRVYYKVQPLCNRNERNVRAVRCDKLHPVC